MKDRLYYALRHFFTGNHWYECSYNHAAKGDEIFLIQACRLCPRIEQTSRKRFDEMIQKAQDMMAAEMFRHAFKPAYFTADPGPKIVKGIDFIGKNILQRYVDRETEKCQAEGHTIPEGEMCRRQYARNVLQEIIDL